MESDQDDHGPSLTEDATAIAGGSMIVMGGGIGERALRMVTTWFLSGALGTAGFGLFAFATTVANIIGALAPIGVDGGATMFGARYRKTGERARLKGVLLSALVTVSITGPLFAALTWAAVHHGLVLADRPDEASAVKLISAGIALVAFVSVTSEVLVSRKDMRGHAWSRLIAIPSVTLLGAVAAVILGLGVPGVIGAFLLGQAAGVAVAIPRIWAADGVLIRDASVKAQTELRALFSYALPQSLARVLYRANLWIDILMLTALGTLADVGVYRVSVALAMLGALPVLASTTMFGPVIAELVYTRQIERLNALLKIVTRWLLVVASPVYFVVLLLPDVVLSIFDEAYLSGSGALAILMAGQGVYVLAAPTGAILSQGGHSTLNLINGLIAVGLNIALNAWLIPTHGIHGAAIASATALSVWSLLRLVQVWALYRCSAFSLRSMVPTVLAVGVGLLSHTLLNGLSDPIRVGVVGLILCLGLTAFWIFGRTAEDDAVIDRVTEKLRRIRPQP
jgi:O-antigen/teichoic acid export membrane protein